MNQRLIVLVLGSVVAVTATVTAAPSSKSQGADIMHFFVRTAFTNDGVEPEVRGTADAKQNTQGNANNQRLDLTFSGLATNSGYHLYAVLDEDDTNYAHVAELNSGPKGSAELRYQSNGNGKGPGKGKQALPAVLNPLSDIRQFAIFNSSTQLVATADLTSPDKLQYLIKRNLSTDAVDATLRIKATTSTTQFRLIASGLSVTNDYLLVFNGSIVETNTADLKGKLAISSLLADPGDILDLRSMALWDSSSNVVLTTELP